MPAAAPCWAAGRDDQPTYARVILRYVLKTITAPGAVRVGIQAEEIPRRETRQDPRNQRYAVFAVDAVVFCARHRHGSIVSLVTIVRDLHQRILQSALVPRPWPVIGCHVELAIALETGHDPIVRISVAIKCGDYEDGPNRGLEESEDGLEGRLMGMVTLSRSLQATLWPASNYRSSGSCMTFVRLGESPSE